MIHHLTLSLFAYRKVLACVICGRLKSAFQIASRSESISDVQYVAHVVMHSLQLTFVTTLFVRVSIKFLATSLHETVSYGLNCSKENLQLKTRMLTIGALCQNRPD